jgi:hypothetical protein
MVFAGGEILEVDDGGIYRLSGPEGSKPSWVSANGEGLQNTEFFALGLNPNGTYIGAAQDNGVAFRTVETDPTGATKNLWTEQRSADGVVAFVGPDGTNYASTQQFDAFRFTTGQKPHFLLARVVGGLPREEIVVGGLSHEFDPGLKAFDKRLPFVTPFRVSAGDGNLMLIGSAGGVLYLSKDKGDTVHSLGGLNDTKTEANAVRALGFDGRRHAIHGVVTTLALGTKQNKGIAYVGTDAGESYRSADVTAGDGGFVRTHFSDPANANGAPPLAFVIDPDNPLRLYVVTSNAVWRTDDAGDKWTPITGNLLGLITPGGAAGTVLGSVALVKGQAGQSDVLLVGGLGGVFRLTNPAGPTRDSPPPTWTGFGQKMPNVFVTALQYDPGKNVLVAGTLGRGAWEITNVVQNLYTPGALVIDGANGAGVTADPNNPLNVIASDGLGNTQSIARALFQSTNIMTPPPPGG